MGKKIRNIFLSLILVVALVFFTETQVFAASYNGKDAIAYADKYALSPNQNFAYFSQGDCANFVSQCLYAAGHEMSGDWYYTSKVSNSYSWVNADGLKNYLKYTFGAKQLVSKWTRDGRGGSYAYVNDSSNMIGDGREVVFYDWDGDGAIDHASFCVGTGYKSNVSGEPRPSLDYGDLISQHTTNRKRVLWHLDEFNTFRNTSELYAFQMHAQS